MATGHVVVAEPSPGSGGRDLAGGPLSRHGSGGGTSYSQAWPAKTHLHPITASLWSERTEGALS